MTRTMPRFGLAIGTASMAMAVAAGLVWWAPFTGGVTFVLPALFGALAAFARGAWRVAAAAVCLSVCVGVAASFGLSVSSPLAEVLVVAPFVVTLALGAWLALDYRRTRASGVVRQLPSWLSTVRDRAGVVLGGLSVAAALCALPVFFWRTFLVPLGIMSFGKDLLPVLQVGLYLFPFAVLGALTAWACGAWRTAALAAFLCIPTLMRVDGLEGSVVIGGAFIGETFASVVAGATLIACLVLSYRASPSRRVGATSLTMPRFGLAVGMVSMAMAVADGLVWWAPFAGGMTLVVPALFGALVAFVHGAWRLASVTACLGLCVAIAVIVSSRAALSQSFVHILALVPFAISLGLGSWLAFDHRQAKASGVLRRLPAWLGAARNRAGVVVGGISLATALGVKSPGWWLVHSSIMEPGVGIALIGGPSIYLIAVCFLGALTALACGAWRTAVLGAFVCVPTLLRTLISFSPEYYRLHETVVPLVAVATFTACLIWSYRQWLSSEAGRTHGR